MKLLTSILILKQSYVCCHARAHDPNTKNKISDSDCIHYTLYLAWWADEIQQSWLTTPTRAWVVVHAERIEPCLWQNLEDRRHAGSQHVAFITKEILFCKYNGQTTGIAFKHMASNRWLVIANRPILFCKISSALDQARVWSTSAHLAKRQA